MPCEQNMFPLVFALLACTSGSSIGSQYTSFLQNVGEDAQFLGRDSFLVDVGRRVGVVAVENERQNNPLTRPQRDDGNTSENSLNMSTTGAHICRWQGCVSG